MAMYTYTSDLTQLEACRTNFICKLPEQALEIVTPLVAQAWEDALAKHPDKEFRHYVIQGIRQGFHIGFDGTGCRAKGAERNMQSAMVNPGPVEEYLKEEAGTGRVSELNPSEDQGIVVNRFGVIPKRGQAGRWRLILDLSYPPGRSVNDGISRELSSLHYVSVDTAIQRVLELGAGALLAKIDIAQAYRNVPVHPVTGHCWE